MRTASFVVGAVAFSAATFAMTRNAHALGPVDLEVGAKVGFATNPASSNSSTTTVNGVTTTTSSSSGGNVLGFGLGARGGVSFMGFYGGVQLMYYFGTSQDESAGGVSATASAHTFMYGLELGYGIKVLDLLTIRPQLGIGNATFSTSVKESGAPGIGAINISGSNSNLYLEPGVTGLVSLGMVFVGADANILFFPGLDNSKPAFSLHGQVGLKF